MSQISPRPHERQALVLAAVITITALVAALLWHLVAVTT